MATTELIIAPLKREYSVVGSYRLGLSVTAALTLFAVFIHGYHPFADDGGVYLVGVKRLLHPELYPYWSDFVTVHLKFSLFAPAVAMLVHLSHLGLATVVFLIYAASIWLTLFAGWQIAARCTQSREGCIGAVTLLAMTLTIPVAGTSLALMDPYVTARSISTPFGLLALVGALDIAGQLRQRMPVSWNSVALCEAGLLIAASVHPLMAAYSLGCLLLLVCVSLPGKTWRVASTSVLCCFAVGLAAFVERISPSPSAGYVEVARTRTYWFLATWHWYELIGLIGPLIVLGWVASRETESGFCPRQALAQMSMAACSSAVLVAMLFARLSSSSFVIAELQPLRIYQTVYAVMLLLIGVVVGESILKRSAGQWVGAAQWAILMAAVGAGMGLVQMLDFPDSAHLQKPGSANTNEWVQGFEWVRDNTPGDSRFALDANYINSAGEDSQNFRAIAERSALPDYAKDGGLASIDPELTAEWIKAQPLQDGLDNAVDASKRARLRAEGIDWIIVEPATPTALECPFVNRALKVCRVSQCE